MIANIFGPDLGIVVIVILVVLLGGSQLPKIARNVGTAGREFRKAQQEAEEDAERDRLAKASKEGGPVPPPAQPLPPAQPSPPPPVQNPATPSAQAAPQPANLQPDPGAPPPAGGNITLTPSELDALLKAREEQVRRESGSSD